jgi:hypothetical protein
MTVLLLTERTFNLPRRKVRLLRNRLFLTSVLLYYAAVLYFSAYVRYTLRLKKSDSRTRSGVFTRGE